MNGAYVPSWYSRNKSLNSFVMGCTVSTCYQFQIILRLKHENKVPFGKILQNSFCFLNTEKYFSGNSYPNEFFGVASYH